MPINGMVVGTDYSISYYDGTAGALVDLGDVQNVQITAQKHDLKSMPYNGPPRYGYMPDGFKIEFTINRTLSTLEDLMVTLQGNIDNGKIVSPGYLNQTTTNSDGSVSRYQYTNFVVFLTDHGNISREKPVPIKLEGWASEKVALA